MDENLIKKTLTSLTAGTIDETSLDELQTKVCFSLFSIYLLDHLFARFLKFFHRINTMVNLNQQHNI
jgi:hypothetical protein